MKEIDARGLACPAPVLKTRAAIEDKTVVSIKVIVDNEAALQNVSRFLESQHFTVESRHEGADICITGTKGDPGASACKVTQDPGGALKKTMIMIATDRIGFGDDELGLKLMVNFIRTLKEMGKELWQLVLVNNGVKLAAEGSQVLPALKELEANGLLILVCGTCLDHYKLLDKKQVGQTTNMLDIVTAMQLADKVITM